MLMCFLIRMLWVIGLESTFTAFISVQQRFGADVEEAGILSVNVDLWESYLRSSLTESD